MSESPLAVGDRLVYPNQGLCTVTEIKTEEIAGQKLTFVSLIITETGARVKVPKDKLAKNGVRRVSTNDDAKQVFEFLKADSERASLDWKKRARDNTARLSEGGLLGLAEVVKNLQILSELRPLPPKEREQYNDARHLFVEELASAMTIPASDAEDALDVVLFPPGKERPKRSIEEFQALGVDDELGLGGDDLLGLDGGDEAAPEADEAKPEGEEADGESDESGDDDEEGGKKKKPAAKAEKKPAAPAEKRGKGLKSLLSDLEVTMPVGTALTPPPKKRGRPPKPKPEIDPNVPPPPPKKRGRPPKPKPAVEVPATPKKRGRPPKAK
jgi:RNA polymerase-interacting CarD/CdnL/TRCF family regulator